MDKTDRSLLISNPMKRKNNLLKRTEEKVRHSLDETVVLPFDWKKEDYESGEERLRHYHLDLISSVDQVANNINGDWASNLVEFATDA